MLAYLEALCSALKARDAFAIGELLRHPLASALPLQVVDEARRIAEPHGAEYLAPLHALRLYHQTAHLLGACTDPGASRRAAVVPRAAGEVTRQMELPLHAAVA